MHRFNSLGLLECKYTLFLSGLLVFQQSRPEGTFLENVSSLLFINVTLVAGRHGPPTVLDRPHTHTDTSTEFHMVFVHVSWRGNMLFPLLRGIYCHRGQSSEFRDQEVTELHHLADRTSKYLEVFTVWNTDWRSIFIWSVSQVGFI